MSTEAADPADPGELVERVAYAIGKEIARKHVEADFTLRKLDGLGKASAIHSMASSMARELKGEAEVAIAAVRAAASWL